MVNVQSSPSPQASLTTLDLCLRGCCEDTTCKGADFNPAPTTPGVPNCHFITADGFDIQAKSGNTVFDCR